MSLWNPLRDDEPESEFSIFRVASYGNWELHSKIDPRWNCSGRSVVAPCLAMPKELDMKVEQLKKKLGKPPKDLTWSYMKD